MLCYKGLFTQNMFFHFTALLFHCKHAQDGCLTIALMRIVHDKMF